MKDIKVVKRKLADLKQAENNIRMHPEKQIKELIRSVEKHGQTRLLVIDEKNVIWIGNGLYQAMVQMGLKEAHCLLKEGMSENEKKKMMAADNRIFDLGLDDMDAVEHLIRELGDDLDIPGYDEDMLRTLTADLPEIDDLASGYGLIEPEQKEKMQAAKETYEKQEEKFAAQASEIAVSGEPGTPQEEPVSSEEETAPAEDTRRFLVCPHCGAKIWL